MEENFLRHHRTSHRVRTACLLDTWSQQAKETNKRKIIIIENPFCFRIEGVGHMIFDPPARKLIK